MAEIQQTEIKHTVTKKKKSKKKLIIFSIAGAILLLIIIAAVVSSKKEKVIVVQTEVAQKRNITQVVSGTGVIQPETKVDISAEVNSEITALPIKEGDTVKVGQLLVKIRADQFSSRMEQQRAGVNYSQTQVEVAQNNLRKAELEYQRLQQLNNSGLISQSDLDNARISYEVAQSQLKSANANVRQNYAILKQSSQELSKTTIKAPMSGVVTKLNSELGERVVGTATMAGTTIMTISDLSSMEADIEVSENDISTVKLGDTAVVDVDAYPDRRIAGVVFEISNTAKSKGLGTQEEIINFIVKLRIIDKDVSLKPGMSCNADIRVKSKFDVVAVPIQSITARDEFKSNEQAKDEDEMKRISEENMKKKMKPKEVVFVIEGSEQKKVKIVTIKTGISDDKYIEIEEGLESGAEIVKGPYKAINKDLETGAKVKVENDMKKIKNEE
jgi:HlyD family secretion protein